MPRYSPGMGVRGFPLTSALQVNKTVTHMSKSQQLKEK